MESLRQYDEDLEGKLNDHKIRLRNLDTLQTDQATLLKEVSGRIRDLKEQFTSLKAEKVSIWSMHSTEDASFC